MDRKDQERLAAAVEAYRDAAALHTAAVAREIRARLTVTMAEKRAAAAGRDASAARSALMALIGVDERNDPRYV